MYTLPCTKEITSESLLYSTGGKKVQSVCKSCIKLTLKMHSGIILLVFMFISYFQNF